MSDLLSLLSNPVLDQKELFELAAKHRGSYASAEPYSHVVIDNFLPAAVLRAVIDEFPGPELARDQWVIKDHAEGGYGDQVQFKKLSTSHEKEMGPVTRKLMQEMNSNSFLCFLQRITGIENLIPDPSYRGAGLHQTLPGGFLKVHVDFNTHHKTRLDRRCNCLIYLNEDWQEEWGGNLEVWNKDVSRKMASIAPIANRCLIFSTVPNSWHGHPHPLRCPEGHSRKSLVHFYYSNGRPQHEVSTNDETTFWHEVPEEA